MTFSWRLWNWKSALASAVLRAPIFFVANLPEGQAAALAAFATEFGYRVVAAGFYGALTQWFATRRSQAASTVAAVVVLPAVAHGVEFLVHALMGTPRIAAALAVSIAASMLTTRLSLFVMRRGLFLSGGQSVGSDVYQLVQLIAAASRGAWARTSAASRELLRG